MNSEMNSGAFSLRLMKLSNAYQECQRMFKGEELLTYFVYAAFEVTVTLERSCP